MNKRFFVRSLLTNSKNKGFTIVELLVALVLVGIISSVAITALSNFLRASERNAVQAKSNLELTRALDFMSEEIRAACQGTISASSTTSLSLHVPTSASSCPQTPTPNVTYDFASGAITRSGPEFNNNGTYGATSVAQVLISSYDGFSLTDFSAVTDSDSNSATVIVESSVGEHSITAAARGTFATAPTPTSTPGTTPTPTPTPGTTPTPTPTPAPMPTPTPAPTPAPTPTPTPDNMCTVGQKINTGCTCTGSIQGRGNGARCVL